MDTTLELYNYCRQAIPSFLRKEHDALERIEQERCPLSMAHPTLYAEMQDAIYDYCIDHGLDADDYDIEDIFWTTE